jgi:hypothetical protein
MIFSPYSLTWDADMVLLASIGPVTELPRDRLIRCTALCVFGMAAESEAARVYGSAAAIAVRCWHIATRRQIFRHIYVCYREHGFLSCGR